MHPKPWATGEAVWRRFVANACSELAPFPSEVVAQADSFHVTLVFSLSPARCRDTDLDNLAKPVLDTLFLIDRPQTAEADLTGALFQANDNRVSKLTLEKRPADSLEDQGVDILIEWQVTQ